jgi:putative SOS response-associated peptidase YedK
MCGRFTLREIELVRSRFGIVLMDAGECAARFNVAPSDRIPVVVTDECRELRWMTWGFRPAWFHPKPGQQPAINARAETLLGRPMFRDELARNRCLIPADGFYEWQVVQGQRRKQPMYIRRKDGSLFAFAGLYMQRWGESRREPEQSCVIITTLPNELVAPIHNRMPVILAREDEDLWLDPTVTDRVAALACLQPYPSEQLEAYPVSDLVNSVRNDRLELIEPAA